MRYRKSFSRGRGRGRKSFSRRGGKRRGRGKSLRSYTMARGGIRL